MLYFLRVKKKDGGYFVFNMKTEPSFKMEECFVDGKEWKGKGGKVFIYKEKLITSYRIGPVDRSELIVIE